MLRAVGKALLKSLLQAALVAGLALAAAAISPPLGAMVGFLGALVMVASSYRKDWRLRWITILAPPLGLLAVLGVQASLLGRRLGEPSVWLGAAVFGVSIGLWRGRAHRVFVKDGQVYAQRALVYLLIWAVCSGISQGLALAGQVDALRFGLLGATFSTVMFATVALVLGGRYRRTKAELRLSALSLLIAALCLPFLQSAHAQERDVAGGWDGNRYFRTYQHVSVSWGQRTYVELSQRGDVVTGTVHYGKLKPGMLGPYYLLPPIDWSGDTRGEAPRQHARGGGHPVER